MEIDWNEQLVAQLDRHWRHQLRPRLDGLSDDEYVWEPVAGAWNVRPRDDDRTGSAAGSGSHVIDWATPEPDPAPVTTIAWRLGHVIVGVLGMRVAHCFGGPKTDYATFAYAPTATEALRQLDAVYEGWLAGVRALDADALSAPSDDVWDTYRHWPLAAVVLHVNREVIHHGAETALLRDLYAASFADQSRRGSNGRMKVRS
ncbi:DinB family protein [Streptomyces tricolor]|uniref:DinB family protein n=1 Tax=Streptomyces tricolor TaxID=68277 RepID=A0ABS9JU47_9ACTN|nr:DinB family protein [Streptomyces tricolor]MCG0069103.1 DinB family protein [Streptomyces tricolor]